MYSLVKENKIKKIITFVNDMKEMMKLRAKNKDAYKAAKNLAKVLTVGTVAVAGAAVGSAINPVEAHAEEINDDVASIEQVVEESETTVTKSDEDIVNDVVTKSEEAVEEKAANEVVEEKAANEVAEEKAANEVAEETSAKEVAEEKAANEVAEEKAANEAVEETAIKEEALIPESVKPGNPTSESTETENVYELEEDTNYIVYKLKNNVYAIWTKDALGNPNQLLWMGNYNNSPLNAGYELTKDNTTFVIGTGELTDKNGNVFGSLTKTENGYVTKTYADLVAEIKYGVTTDKEYIDPDTVTPYKPVEPTEEPTIEPTEEPKEEPTVEPTEEPTVEPTEEPTVEPTEEPTVEEVVDKAVEETTPVVEQAKETVSVLPKTGDSNLVRDLAAASLVTALGTLLYSRTRRKTKGEQALLNNYEKVMTLVR